MITSAGSTNSETQEMHSDIVLPLKLIKKPPEIYVSGGITIFSSEERYWGEAIFTKMTSTLCLQTFT